MRFRPAIRAILPITLSVALAFAGVPGTKPARADDRPIDITADEVGYDRDLGIYVARGHVEMTQGDRVLMADTVSYNENSRTLTASGNVTLLQPNGDTVFGTYMDASDDFQNGVVDGFRELFADRSRLAANQARRIGGTRWELDNAVYTPCQPCKSDPSRAPLWQIKARHVVRDTETKVVRYRDAWMEMFGVPIFYTPYFEHADFGLDRKTGFLTPGFNYSEKSGFQFRTPYFINLGPDRDMTLTPVFNAGLGTAGETGGMAMVEYRQRVLNGFYRLAASATSEDRPDDDDRSSIHHDAFRGHAEGEGLFDINRHWRSGFNFKNTTDNSYLKHYHLPSQQWLEDQIWGEGFFGRSYFAGRAYGFQTTERNFEDKHAPIVAPYLNYNFIGEPSRHGGYWQVNLNSMNITRRAGTDSFRLSAIPSWTLPYTSTKGDVYKLSLSMQGDMYVVNDGVENDGSHFSGAKGRFLPKASFEWRYPFVRPGASWSQVLEPIVQLVGAPDWNNSSKIPNEDSRVFDLNDTDILAPDRFSGLDRIDAGSRATYGFDWSLYGPKQSQANFFLGQSYQFDHGHNDRGNGIANDLTDMVGRALLSPSAWLDLGYRFRFDVEKGDLPRQEIGTRIGPDNLYLATNYAHLKDDSDLTNSAFLSEKDSEDMNREQVGTALHAKFDDYWSTNIGAIYDLDNTTLLTVGGSLDYQDECFGMTIRARHNEREDTLNDEGNYAFYVGFSFKNLGSLKSAF